MADLSAFPIVSRWPAQHPDRLQLYSFPTPNGVKVSIALEETGLPYEAHGINIMKNETWTPEFLSLNPNGKIPAILDPNGPGGKPLVLFESGAILLYLADKTGKLMPTDVGAALRDAAVGVLPDGRRRADVRAARLLPQVRRQGDRRQAPAGALPRRVQAPARRDEHAPRRPQVVHGRGLSRSPTSPMSAGCATCIGFYEAGEIVGIENFPHVLSWLDRAMARPASQRGVNIPPRG